jgi:hypothetical protein
VLGKYQYEGDGLENGECGLRIKSGINVDEDLGNWMCLARLQGRKSEGHDYIIVKAVEAVETKGMLTTNQ